MKREGSGIRQTSTFNASRFTVPDSLRLPGVFVQIGERDFAGARINAIDSRKSFCIEGSFGNNKKVRIKMK